MEPMTLGSPTHSPSNSPNATYLPPFLTGEVSHSTTPRTNSLSPTKGRNIAFVSPPSVHQSSTPDTQMSRTKFFIQNQSAIISPQNIQHNTSNSFTNKPNGPPTQGLFDTLHKQPWVNQSKDQSLTNMTVFSNINMNQSYLVNQSSGSQYINETNYTDNSYIVNEEECWVTIFGFTPSSSNVVFAHFANCGNIIDRHYPPQGNWAHICFSSRAEKLRALSLNGRELSPGIMVGVIDCKDPPASHNSFRYDNNRSLENQSPTTPQPFCPSSVPTSSNGFLSKALEYIFGL